MSAYIRNLVSGSRHRYVDSEFNLDLTYITPNIIAMSTPSTSTTSALYRNPLDQISKFFNSKHKNHYMIFNLSEFTYDKSLLNHNVQDIGFPDHFPPTLTQMFTILRSMDSWMSFDDRNLVAVHCKAGKSRTGLIICTYLLWKGEFSSVGKAVKYFLWKRGEGIGSPSQILYLKYFFSIITEGKIINAVPLHLRSLYIHGINQQFVNHMKKNRIVIQIFKTHQIDVHDVKHILIYSTKTHDMDQSLGISDVVSFSVPHIELEGDIIVVGKSITNTGSKKLFRFAFHTGFVDTCILRVKKNEMDHAFKNKTLSNEFMIDLMFLPGSKKNEINEESDDEDDIGINAMKKFNEKSNSSKKIIQDKALNFRISDENQLLRNLYGKFDPNRKKMKWIKIDISENHYRNNTNKFIKINIRPSLEVIYNEQYIEEIIPESSRSKSDYQLAHTLYQESTFSSIK